MADLYTSNHQLNYDEVVRRIDYWAGHNSPRGATALRILAAALDRNRDNLYFESREKQS